MAHDTPTCQPAPRSIEDIWQDLCRAYTAFNADPKWEDAEVAASYFDRIDKAEMDIVEHPCATRRAAEIRLWIALRYTATSSVSRQGSRIAHAIEQGDAAPIIAARDELDWQEKLIFAAILNLRGENL